MVEEELDETIHWLDYTNDIDPHWSAEIKPLRQETNELLAITVASIKTASKNLHSEKSIHPNPKPNPKN